MQTKKAENISEEFKSNVNKGMVLGKNGDWCSIDKAIHEEKELHIHLENGEVLHNGEWIPIIEALENGNIDMLSEPVLLNKNKADALKSNESFKNRIDKSSHLKITRKKDFDSQKEVKKLYKRKKKRGIKKGIKNIHKVNEESPPIKEDKILLADVNIQVDKTKSNKIDPVIKKETSIKRIKPESGHEIVGNENEMTGLMYEGKNKTDCARTQIFKKSPPKTQKEVNKILKPDFISSDKTLVKKLSKETLTFEENITQIIPLSIHIFKGKQIKTKRKSITSKIEKNKLLPDESLEDWAKTRSNFIRTTILFSVSALLVSICFYILYYFVIL